MTDMTNKLFEKQPFGKLAIKKLGDVPENFRLYHAEWIGSNMRITGAEFRHAKRGHEKGMLSVKVPNTKHTVYVSATEIKQFEENRE